MAEFLYEDFASGADSQLNISPNISGILDLERAKKDKTETTDLSNISSLSALSKATRITNMGSFNGNILQYSPGRPSITITRKKQYNPDSLGRLIGRPSNESVKLGNLSGYTVIKSCHLEIPSATSDEVNEIKSLLEEGVIL